MSRMRSGALARKKKPAKLDAKVKSRPPKKTRGRALKAHDEDDDEDERGRFEPPRSKNSTPAIIAVVIGVILVGLVAIMAGGGSSSLVDEHEAEKAYNYVDNQYKLAKGGDALAENRAALRQAFEKVVEAYPGTESAKLAQKRIKELQ
jgi:hypothetical protein